MRILQRYVQCIIAMAVLLLVSSTFCYADILNAPSINIQFDPVQSFQMSASRPEPATMLLLGIGLILLSAVLRKGKRTLS